MPSIHLQATREGEGWLYREKTRSRPCLKFFFLLLAFPDRMRRLRGRVAERAANRRSRVQNGGLKRALGMTLPSCEPETEERPSAVCETKEPMCMLQVSWFVWGPAQDEAAAVRLPWSLSLITTDWHQTRSALSIQQNCGGRAWGDPHAERIISQQLAEGLPSERRAALASAYPWAQRSESSVIINPLCVTAAGSKQAGICWLRSPTASLGFKISRGAERAKPERFADDSQCFANTFTCMLE
ncbi:hypothetical protein SKAU_G00248230 [Synaphobranchus kaupii]|uniref:Uncharacterized protein n=1 Tax=Synaphobranchus kaupii TaxID=118154 RepID=A0A9Q1F2B7_SYNKA|nr:hypothetical protein SKAU_G00248230 [Synaphobranchus kaupii]